MTTCCHNWYGLAPLWDASSNSHRNQITVDAPFGSSLPLSAVMPGCGEGRTAVAADMPGNRDARIGHDPKAQMAP